MHIETLSCNNAPSLDNAPSHVWCIKPFNSCILNHEYPVTSTHQFASISQYCASASTCSLNNLQTMHCWWLMHLELFHSTIDASQLFHIRVFKNTVRQCQFQQSCWYSIKSPPASPVNPACCHQHVLGKPTVHIISSVVKSYVQSLCSYTHHIFNMRTIIQYVYNISQLS